jgi:23S rRNA (uracil747-C5)-methyltransferase
MQCSYFDAARCLSCTHMGRPYDEQLAGKQLHCQTLLSDHTSVEWLPPVASRESGFPKQGQNGGGRNGQEPHHRDP